MAYSKCVVCDNCGKHAEMMPIDYTLPQPKWVERIPVGWFIYRNHKTENIDMEFTVYCSKVCVSTL